MSTAAAADGHRDRSHSLLARGFALLGHHGDVILGFWMIVNAIHLPSDQPDGWLYFPPKRDRSKDSWLDMFSTPAGWWTIVLIAVMLVVLAAWVRHLDKLCEDCVREFPLDAKATAEKYDRRLRAHHNLWLWVPLLIVAVAAPLFPPQDTWWPIAMSALCGVAWVYRGFATVMHRRVRPWCPICGNRDEGGEGALTPTPDPAPGVKVTA